VAGWGSTKTRLIRVSESNSHIQSFCFNEVLNGQEIIVRGIQNTPQHVEVPQKKCEDVRNGVYPNGLICSGDKGLAY